MILVSRARPGSCAYERALAIQEREFGPDHRELAATLGNLGGVWGDLGQPGKARELYERALAIQEREFGPDHPEVATTLGNLGSVWGDLGEPGNARGLYERALRILRTHFPKGHPHTDVVVRSLRVIAPDLIVFDDGRVIDPQGGR